MWQPTEEQINDSQMMEYIRFVNEKFELQLSNYNQLYAGTHWKMNQLPLIHFAFTEKKLIKCGSFMNSTTAIFLQLSLANCPIYF